VSRDQLSRPSTPAMNRRRFIAGVGAALAGGSLFGLASACGAELTALVPSPTGALHGTVVDAGGVPRGVGRVYLLNQNGFNPGVHADVDGTGRFDFGAVPTGAYQLRFWGASQASVPETFPNPVPIVVSTDTTTSVQFVVALGESKDGPEQEIYLGEYFFQAQPTGQLNGNTTVKLGTTVCWYNVGGMLHDVSGGPWGSSGPIVHGGSFMWTSDRLGTFPYRCSYHGAQMLATVTVIA
jgi:hypothetical protein